jgi:hypothetical protein
VVGNAAAEALPGDSLFLPGVLAAGAGVVGEAAGMAYGVHRAYRRRGRTYGDRLRTTLPAGVVAGAMGAYALSATGAEKGPAARIVIAMPLLQLGAVVADERRRNR